MEKVAVFPVPDCACAITSCPTRGQCMWWGRWNVGKLTLNDGHDGTLLDSRRALETVGVDATEELGLEVHRVEGVDRLIVVGFDLAWKVALSVFCSTFSQTESTAQKEAQQFRH